MSFYEGAAGLSQYNSVWNWPTISRVETGFFPYAADDGNWNTYFKPHYEIEDVRVIVPNKVVEVTFVDGSKQKSVCDDENTFSLEMAISICIAKKLLGGTSKYNKVIDSGLKAYQDRLNKEIKDKEEKERIEKKRAKRLAYKQRRAERRAAEEKERQIEIQKEAYVRAMRKINGEK